MLQLKKDLENQISKPFLIDPTLKSLKIDIRLFALFPLFLTNGENLLSRVDQAVKNRGDDDHKK